MHAKGVDAVVARVSMQFKTPLRCDDEFVSRLALHKEGVRFVFNQDIFRASDNQLSCRAKVEVVALVNGQLAITSPYDDVLAAYVSSKES